MKTYLINKREYIEVDRQPVDGDKAVSKVDFDGDKVSEGDILEIDYVTIQDDYYSVSFQKNGLWSFSSSDEFSVIEPTNKPISFEQEIMFLEDQLDRNHEYCSKLEIRIDDMQKQIDSLIKAVKPINALRQLLNGVGAE